MRWLAVVFVVIAVACRLALRHFAFDIAFRVTPEHHRAIPIDNFLFWGFIGLGIALAFISFVRTSH